VSGRVVWVVDGDTMQVRVGRGMGTTTIPPALFVTLDREAREAGRGLRRGT
jgi:hypothetical protein